MFFMCAGDLDSRWFGGNKRRRKSLTDAVLFSLYSPSSASIRISYIWNCVVFSLSLALSLTLPYLHTALGPLVECCILWGLWRKGIPGQSQSEHTHTHIHMHARTCINTLTATHSNTHTRTNTAAEKHHNHLADVQIKDGWRWKAFVSREGWRQRNPLFSTYVVLNTEDRNLANSRYPNLISLYRAAGYYKLCFKSPLCAALSLAGKPMDP